MPLSRRRLLAASAAARPVRMHLGSQRRGDLGREHLEYFKRHGVEHIAGWPPDAKEATLADDLSRAKEDCARHGVSLDIAQVPLLAGPPVAAILLGKDPERGREIDYLHKLIQACAAAGIPAFKYNLRVLFGVRSGLTPGRGGSSYSTWRFDDIKERSSRAGGRQPRHRHVLGAHHVLSRPRHSRLQRAQDSGDVPSPRPGRAAVGLQGR